MKSEDGDPSCFTACCNACCEKCKNFCDTPVGGKIVAVAFWLLLNTMVLSVIVWDNSDVTRQLRDGSSVAPYVFFSVVGLSGVLFLRASFMDPGYLPDAKKCKDATRNTGKEEMEYCTDESVVPPKPPKDSSTKVEMEENSDQKVDVFMPPVRKENVEKLWGIDGWEYVRYEPDQKEDQPVRYCALCNMWMSLRSKHCPSCRKCVALYDHHCIWMGNCVGERSRATFWWYLVAQTTAVIWALYYIESSIQWSGFDGNAWGVLEGFIWANGCKCLLFLFILLCSWLPMCLLIYHSYLILTNQTTWEYNRSKRISYLSDLDEGERPFDHGPLANIRLLCCTPGLLKWRAMGFPKGRTFGTQKKVGPPVVPPPPPPQEKPTQA